MHKEIDYSKVVLVVFPKENKHKKMNQTIKMWDISAIYSTILLFCLSADYTKLNIKCLLPHYLNILWFYFNTASVVCTFVFPSDFPTI